jgi:hypothetical protein
MAERPRRDQMSYIDSPEQGVDLLRYDVATIAPQP